MRYLDEVNNLRRRLAARHQAGEFGKCMILGEKLIQLHKKHKNTYSINFADDLFNLATVYEETGRFEHAKLLYADSLAIIETFSGGSLEFADRLSVQAGVYSKTGDYLTALGMYMQAEHIKKKSLGEEHKEYADALYNVGNALYDGSMYKRAVRSHMKALKINSKDKGNISYADSLNALGYCHEAMGELEIAGDYFANALVVTEKIVGEESDGFIADLMHYAGFLNKKRDFAKAVKTYNKAASLIKKVYSENHMHYAEALCLTADACENGGNIEKALNMRNRAFGIMKKTLGKNHLYLANNIRGLAIGYHTAGNREKAIKNIKETLRIKETLIGCANEDYIRDMLLLISFYLEDGDYKNMKVTLRNTLKRMKTEQAPPYFSSLTELCLMIGELAKLKKMLTDAKNGDDQIMAEGSFSSDLLKSEALVEMLRTISDKIN